jgi:hypothetical protein
MESLRAFSIQSIQEEVKILDNDANWNQLLCKEALKIDRNDPSLNKGLKSIASIASIQISSSDVSWKTIYCEDITVMLFKEFRISCTVKILCDYDLNQNRNIVKFGIQVNLTMNLLGLTLILYYIRLSVGTVPHHKTGLPFQKKRYILRNMILKNSLIWGLLTS